MTRYRLKGTSGAVLNRVYPLDGRLLFGRSEDCDVRIDDSEVAPHHAEIWVDPEHRVRLRDLGHGASLVNGRPVSECELASGDEVRIGSCRWLLQAPGLRPQRILTDTAARPARRHYWPWLLLVALGLAAALAWFNGWLPVGP
ncbi:MAG: FHA domain-containing protein [Xanthomonadales bacterium]|nr:FHA domain-containing protein [Xanthomonadales bacterium]NIN58246.1 FHA domain-containing protein [Xanthomonadales bacterium]NIN73598.1 FHA domain-containing protein [Xanthomonadales bacterium]NIO13713.1 FHA domain-containing protein [Xanthomonadales bacterium]NIP10639.1 FHA domain-containing protein [Xanthomonadales bacterium]